MSIVKPQICVFVPSEQFHELPLIVSHTNYKKMLISPNEMPLKGYQFFNEEEAQKYMSLLKQLGIDFKHFSLMLPVEKFVTNPELPTAITAAKVRALRDYSGFSMMQCKQALVYANGDVEQAKLGLIYPNRGGYRTCLHSR